MKILQVNAVYKILSTGRTCSELSDYLNAHGSECLTAYSTGTAMDHSVRISPVWECKLHALFSRIFGLQGYFSPVSTHRLIALIKKSKPDIVSLGNLHANYLSLTHLLKFLGENDIATVVRLDDCWDYTGKCTHYTTDFCDRWKTGCHNCPKLKQDHNSWFFDRTKTMWKDKYDGFSSIPRLAVIGVSDWITEEARKSPMFEKARIIQRIYNWIDLEIFKPQPKNRIKKKLNIENCKIILGVASGWSNKKGLDIFIELSKKLSDNEKIVLVGKMPDVKLPGNVIPIPATDKVEQLVEYYSAADVFLQLSQQETFGKVVAEALACGCPVITNSQTANPELVKSGCGIVLQNMAVNNVYNAVNTIFKTPSDKFAANCRDCAIEYFDKTSCIKEYYDVFYKLTTLR